MLGVCRWASISCTDVRMWLTDWLTHRNWRLAIAHVGQFLHHPLVFYPVGNICLVCLVCLVNQVSLVILRDFQLSVAHLWTDFQSCWELETFNTYAGYIKAHLVHCLGSTQSVYPKSNWPTHLHYHLHLQTNPTYLATYPASILEIYFSQFFIFHSVHKLMHLHVKQRIEVYKYLYFLNFTLDNGERTGYLGLTNASEHDHCSLQQTFSWSRFNIQCYTLT